MSEQETRKESFRKKEVQEKRRKARARRMGQEIERRWVEEEDTERDARVVSTKEDPM